MKKVNGFMVGITIAALMLISSTCFAQAAVKPVHVQLDKPSVLLAVGETSALKMLISPAGRQMEKEYTEKMGWASADAGIATVDDKGTVTGKKLGKTTVTANSMDGKIVKTCRVTVIKDKKKIAIEAMLLGWVNAPQPSPDQDVYKQWIDKAFNVDFKLNASANFKDQVMVRFAAKNPPDMVLGSRELLLKLHDQGLVVSDWNKYLSSIPTIDKTYFTKEARLVLTDKGKLFALATGPTPQRWGLQIRKDWMKKLNLQMPKTPDELMDVAKKFVKNDMYGKGKNNTIAFTDSDVKTGPTGAPCNFSGFTIMWGPDDWFVTADGKVSHSIVAGYKEKMLQYGRQAITEGLMDPDWATQGWDERKPKIYDGQIGIIWYPGDAIVYETSDSGKQADPTEMWVTFDNPPKGAETGGAYPDAGYYDMLKTVSTAAERDPVKMERILYILETLTTPHEDYYVIREGVQIDGMVRSEMADGTPIVHYNGGQKAYQAKAVHPNIQADDYANWIASGNQIYTPLPESEPNKLSLYALGEKMKVVKAKKYPNVGGMLAFTPKDLEGANKVWAQFYVNYLTGKDTDYQAFVQRWLKAGGQNMIDSATQQLKTLKYIK